MLMKGFPKFLSFDTETTVTRKSHFGAPSVIQLATFDMCLIIQIYRMTLWAKSSGLLQNNTPSQQQSSPNHGDFGYKPTNFPPKLKSILEDPSILKIGINSHHDSNLLNQYYSLQCAGVFDFQPLFKAIGEPSSLAKFAQKYADHVYHDKETNRRHIWRDHLKRNWERNYLNKEEINYASRDVFAVLSALRNIIRKSQAHLLPIQGFGLETAFEKKKVFNETKSIITDNKSNTETSIKDGTEKKDITESSISSF